MDGKGEQYHQTMCDMQMSVATSRTLTMLMQPAAMAGAHHAGGQEGVRTDWRRVTSRSISSTSRTVRRCWDPPRLPALLNSSSNAAAAALGPFLSPVSACMLPLW